MNQIAISLCIMGMSAENITPYEAELKRRLGAKVICDKKDYIHFVNILYQMGIDANVKVIPLSKEITYGNWEETVAGVVSRVQDREIYLERSREEVEAVAAKFFKKAEDGTYHYRLHYRGTLVFWKPVSEI